jgi:hypothetical protein
MRNISVGVVVHNRSVARIQFSNYCIMATLLQAVSQPQVTNPPTKEERKFQGTAFVAPLLPTGE